MLTPTQFHENKIDQEVKDCRIKINQAMHAGQSQVEFRGRLSEHTILLMFEELKKKGWYVKCNLRNDLIHGYIETFAWQDTPFEEEVSLKDKIKKLYCNEDVAPEFKYLNAYTNGFLLLLVSSLLFIIISHMF